MRYYLISTRGTKPHRYELFGSLLIDNVSRRESVRDCRRNRNRFQHSTMINPQQKKKQCRLQSLSLQYKRAFLIILLVRSGHAWSNFVWATVQHHELFMKTSGISYIYIREVEHMLSKTSAKRFGRCRLLLNLLEKEVADLNRFLSEANWLFERRTYYR